MERRNNDRKTQVIYMIKKQIGTLLIVIGLIIITIGTLIGILIASESAAYEREMCANIRRKHTAIFRPRLRNISEHGKRLL